MLEDLCAEHEIERPILHRQGFDRAGQVGARVLLNVDADVIGGPGEERVVRLDAAPDVEDALTGRRSAFGAKPVGEGSADRPAGNAPRWVTVLTAGPVVEIGHARHPTQPPAAN